MHNFLDSKLNVACHAIENGEATNWLVMEHNGTQDTMSLIASGTKGLSEFRDNLLKSNEDQIMFGFARTDADRCILITWLPDGVGAKRKAKAKKRGRAMAKLLKNDAHFTASTAEDVSYDKICAKLEYPGEQRQTSLSSLSPTSIQSEAASANVEPAEDDKNPFDTPFAEVTDDGEDYEDENDNNGSASEKGVVYNEDDPGYERDDGDSDAEKSPCELTEEDIRGIQMAEEERERLEEERQRLEEERQRLEEEKQRREEDRKRFEEEMARAEAERRVQHERRMEKKKEADEIASNHKAELCGYVSLQPDTSMLWKRRYFILRGQYLMLYYDDVQTLVPLVIIDLNGANNFGLLNPEDAGTYIHKGFTLHTKANITYQMYADCEEDVGTYMKTFQHAVQAN